MKVFTNIEKYTAFLKNINKSPIGFVPTMGALHKGHLSLIKIAKSQNKIVVASIFVNPTQFNDSNDFQHYPRTVKEDIEKLTEVGCDAVIVPAQNEIYPNDNSITVRTIIDLKIEHLTKTMEGKYRPGHFEGVVNVVQRLFSIAKPNNCYLGEKDFQQLHILKKMAQNLSSNIKVIGCPTYREADGLAMSSRNELLTPIARKSAPLIHKTLLESKQTWQVSKSKVSKTELTNWITKTINKSPHLNVEYVEIVNGDNLESINIWEENQNPRCCIACFAGEVRLIDNISYIN